MTTIFWGLLAAIIALAVCRWHEAGRKVDAAKSLAFDEYEQAVESAKRRHPAGKERGQADSPSCACPPCPGRGNDGHGMTHCAECCFGSGVEADEFCPVHGRADCGTDPEPTVLVGRVPWFDRVNGDVERDIDPDGHLSDEQWGGAS